MISITLIPNITNDVHHRQLRPLSCCNVIYKLMAKIITRKMQGCIPKIIDVSQSGFIPKRKIMANVLLTSKLMKGYGRMSMFLRCIIKIDLKKAYE